MISRYFMHATALDASSIMGDARAGRCQCRGSPATNAQRQAMRELAASIEQAGLDNDEESYLDLSRGLNTLPVAAADNEYLQAALDLMYGLVRRFCFAHDGRNASLENAGRLHAIASGDAEAAKEAAGRLNRYFEEFACSTIESATQEHR